jgi:hypothetical protein
LGQENHFTAEVAEIAEKGKDRAKQAASLMRVDSQVQ